jgi:hypothetical protein
MTGFNKFYLNFLLLGTLVISGCIPLAKKTECKSNEAFNSSTRSCTPVTPGQDEFITLANPVPATPSTVTASSGLPVSLSVNIKNPYARPYRMRWIRNHNGTQYTLFSADAASPNMADHPYSISVTPSTDLLGAAGTHVVSAQILDNNLNVITSHDFNLTLSNNPTPYGNGFNPILTLPITMSPDPATSRTFSMTVYQNGANLFSPQVVWSLDKLTGTPLPARSQTDSLTFGTPTSGDTVSFDIDSNNPMNNGVAPTAPFNDIVGTYRLSASIVDGVTTYTTYSWDVTIAHPTLGVISDATLPTPGVSGNTINAYNSVPYLNTTLPNFSYASGATRAQMCVQVSDADGRYGSGVTVRYYLGSNAAPIYSGTTTGVDDTVCLEDAPNATKSTILFSDPDADLTWSTSIKARVFDAATGEEYTSYPSGSYPMVWSIKVNPQNSKPALAFEDITGSVACTTTNAAGTLRSGCAVTQSNATVNNSFVVAFRVTDDFYALPANDDKISYSALLTRGGSTIDSTSCVKAFTDTGTYNDSGTDIDDFIGPVYECRFQMPSFDANGSLNPSADLYAVALSVTDDGSPFTATRKTATLNWNFTVTELNTAPSATTVISQNSAPFTTITTATEGDTISFNTVLTDPERDPYRMELRKCGAGSDATTCVSPSSPLATSSLTYYSDSDYGVPTPNRRLVFAIPDGFVADLATPTTVFFQVRVIDQASTATAVNAGGVVTVNNTLNLIVQLDINNLNPAPVFANPAAIDINLNPLETDYTVISGFPLTLDPGTVTDASNPGNPTEGNIVYQWLISADSGTTWNNIVGATTRVLKWTPGPDVSAGDYQIIGCATDGSPLRPNALSPASAGSNCNDPAIVRIEPNIALSFPPIGGKTLLGPPAVWIDTNPLGTIATHPNSKVVYTATSVLDPGADTTPGTADDIVTIEINKFFYNANNEGQLEHLASTEFLAVETISNTEVFDLSMTGDNNSLYIGYRAYIGIAPATYRPQIRRINKEFNETGFPGAKTAYTHPGPLGFSYTGYTISTAPICNSGAGCFEGGGFASGTWTEGAITLDADELADEGNPVSVTINGRVFTISNLAADANILATDIANAINSDADPLTRGVVASNTGLGKVEITGPMSDDSIIINNNTSMMGEIFIAAGVLYIPYINDSLSSPNTGKITVSTISTSSAKLSSLAVGESPLTSFDPASYISNKIDASGNLIIGLVSASTPGQAKVIKFSGVDLTSGVQYSIFPGVNISKFELAADVTGNTNYHALGKSGSDLWVTRFPNDMSSFLITYKMQDTTDTTTANALTSNTIYDFQIATARPKSPATVSEEARITLVTNNGVLAFRARTPNYVTCGECNPISMNGQAPLFDPLFPNNRTLFTTPILANITIGTGGNSVAENSRNIMMFGYLADDGVDHTFNLGLINTDVEVINSTTTDTVNGFYAPAIFK